MAFPEDPLGLRVEIKAGVWTDITGSVYSRNPIRHTRGIRSNGSTADPATVPLTINNKDGRFSPRNPMGPFYRLIGRNTPVRLSLPGGEHFLDLDGGAANYASTPSVSALNITGDLDLRAEVSASWYQSGSRTLIGKWDAATAQRSYLLRIEDGVLMLHLAASATALTYYRFTLPPLPERAALRATFQATNGHGGSHVAAYWATSMDGPWTLLAEADVTTHSSSASTAPLVVAPVDLTQEAPRYPFEGRGYRFEVRSGINGTVVASPNFTQQPVGRTPFTDSAGRTWSYSGTAAVADRRDLFVGEIASWPQKWVASGADVWTPVEAAGILRRYGQGAKALDSTLRRRIPSGRPIAYWPMEEDRYATRAYSPIEGVTAAALTSVEWASLDTLPSSKPLPKIAAGSQLSAIVPAAAAGQWQVEFVYNADDKAPPESGARAELIGVSTTGTVRRWVVAMRAGNVRLFGYDAGGTDIIFSAITVGADVFHGWVRLRLWARDTGTGTVEWFLAFQDVGGDAGGLGGTFAGASGRVTAVTGTWTEATAGWGIGHLAVFPTAQNFIFTGSDDAYAGETAWTRMRRLAGEESIPVGRIAGPLAPQLVGPQRPETLLALLQEAADADGGMLVEDRTRLGLLYRDRSSLYTQEPALVLDYAAGQIAAGSLEPTDDDSATRNDITITRTGGSSARSVLEDGPLSVQDPPDGIGRYDESISLNLNDDLQPEYIAPWRLHLRTYDGARYPSLSVRLHKHPELIDDVLRLREGDIIRLVNLPPWVAYGPVDLLLTGMSEQYLPRTWEWTGTCEPGGPWMTAKADHPTYGKADTDGSALATAATATDTALAVQTTVGATWTDDPAEAPWDIQVGGEIARVDAVGQLLNLNPWLDKDTSDWLPQSASISRVVAPSPVHSKASASLRIVPDGVAAGGGTTTDRTPVGSIIPGRQYRVCGWFYTPLGWSDLQPCLDWYTATNSYISTGFSSTGFAVPAGQWTYLAQQFTAPTTASRAVLRARHGGTPASSKVWYAWGVRLLGPTDAAAADAFTRTATGGWGIADSGQAWAIAGGPASDRSVDGSRGVVALPSAMSTARCQTLMPGVRDCEVRCRIQIGQVSTGNTMLPGVLLRFVDTSNYYRARLHFSTSGGVFVSITRDVTQLGTTPQVGTYVAGDEWEVRARVDGHRIRIRAWKVGAIEPSVWHQDVTVTTGLIEAGAVGLVNSAFSGNTNVNPVARFDNFQIVGAQRLTVTRSRNGVVKAHAAGAPVSLAYPAITSL